MTAFTGAIEVLHGAIEARIFPAAVAAVGTSAGALWQHALGRLTFDPDSAPASLETPFDLASLTKVVATTTVVMELVADRRLSLDEPVSGIIDEWLSVDREAVTVRDLLEHASGLPARLVDPPPPTRREFEHEICAIRLEYPPRTKSIYSDLGFILLGFVIANRGGESLADQFDRVRARLEPDTIGLTFTLEPEDKHRSAPTTPLDDDPRRGRLLIGEVHDAYAAALGGVAGHAGLFGTATSVGAFARVVLRAARGIQSSVEPFTPERMATFLQRSSVPGSSRALGWDTMLPTSSCGMRMSPAAFGHVGFTGTSLWIDPMRDRYFVLLTNRACGGDTVEDMRLLRRAFHDALADV
jgi:CubicO group peptidase (beta-lactamase class C family)